MKHSAQWIQKGPWTHNVQAVDTLECTAWTTGHIEGTMDIHKCRMISTRHRGHTRHGRLRLREPRRQERHRTLSEQRRHIGLRRLRDIIHSVVM